MLSNPAPTATRVTTVRCVSCIGARRIATRLDHMSRSPQVPRLASTCLAHGLYVSRKQAVQGKRQRLRHQYCWRMEHTPGRATSGGELSATENKPNIYSAFFLSARIMSVL